MICIHFSLFSVGVGVGGLVSKQQQQKKNAQTTLQNGIIYIEESH